MRLFTALLLTTFAIPALATTFAVDVEIPRLRVAEYHAPYVAFWLRNTQSGQITPLGLWYDDQEKWLKDLRLWWRRTGRSQSQPYDGLTGASQRPGQHSVDFSDLAALQSLPEGEYELVVEAAREVGGREVIRVPFQWPTSDTLTAQGDKELGALQLTLSP